MYNIQTPKNISPQCLDVFLNYSYMNIVKSDLKFDHV